MNDDLDSRTRKLEGQIQDFRIVHLNGEVKGGFGPLKQSADLEQRIKNVEESFRTFRLTGGEGVKVSGGVKFGGYVIEAKPPTVDSGTATGGGSDGTGACCVEADCSITTEADCAGVYQGDDTLCDPNPCACPEISLSCDQIVGTFCGYLAYDGSLHAYLTRTEVYTASYSCTGVEEWCPCLDGCSTAYDRTDIYSLTVNEAGECHGGGCSGSGLAHTVCDDLTCDDEYNCTNDNGCIPGGQDGPQTCDIDGWFSNTCPDTPDVTTTTYSCDAASRSGTANQTFTLSDENTGTVSSYDDDFNDPCEATLSSDVSGVIPLIFGAFGFTRFRPKFSFAASAINFTIQYNEHFVPTVGSPVDVPRSVNGFIGDVEIIGSEVQEPTEDGTITITDIVCVPA